MFCNRFIFVLLAILITSSLSSLANQQAPVLKNVLVLHSYNSGLSWTDNINRGIFDSFKEEYHRTIDLRVEYLDAKHFEDPSYYANYRDFLLQKYKNVKIDLIISADNAAFDFLVVNKEYLFNNCPVVFCGLNYCDSIPKGYTGVMEDVDISTNINTILKLHPNYQKLYIVNDKSITGRSISKEMIKVFQSSFPSLKYEFLTDYSLSELKSKLNSLDKRAVVLMVLFNFDRTGMAFSYDIILDDLIPYCNVPMYGLWDFYLGKGIVGGTISNGYDHGSKAGKMALKILNGQDVNTIKVVSGPTKNCYDDKVLDRFNIDKSLLPENSEISNRPYEFIVKNKLIFSLLGIIITLLCVLVAVLLYINQKVKRNLNKEKNYTEIIKAKSEDLKVALEKVENANKLKTSFLCNLSHEIRTPMNGILGFTTLMASEKEFDNQQEYIDIININVNNLLVVINDILDISRIESNQVHITKDYISINEMLGQAVRAMEKEAASRKLTIVLSKSQSIQSPIVFTDGNKFSQVITNLLSNAIKFSENGTINIGYDVEDHQYLFYCQDEGIGIYPQNIDLIFEPFRKIEHTNNVLYGGNGLGLAISKAHIELLGGKIWVESAPECGSIFYFTIPKTL